MSDRHDGQIEQWTTQIHQGDSFDLLEELPDDSVHTIITDPPYNFEDGFMGMEWDDLGEPEQFERWTQEWAKKALRVLKPGGLLLAFCGDRSYHRLACGVEDAGFRVPLKHTLCWLYSNGFPKASDVSKRVDEEAYKQKYNLESFGDYLKKKREEKGLSKKDIDQQLGTNTAYAWWEGRTWQGRYRVQLPNKDHYVQLKSILDLDDRFDDMMEKEGADRKVVGQSSRPEGWFTSGDGHLITESKTEDGRRWEGWKSDLKPAIEFILMAQKRLDGTIAQNVLENETGVFNVKDCSVGEDRHPSNLLMDESTAEDINVSQKRRFFHTSKASTAERTLNGRIEEPHPTVKPLDLIEWLVRLVTREGHIILDPFAGTGTTCLASKNLNRQWIGFEKDEKWCNVAQARCGLPPDDPSCLTSDGQEHLGTFAAVTDGGSE